MAFGALYSAVQKHGSTEVGLPTDPNFFLFSDPSEAVTRLEAVGFASISISTVPQTWRLDSPEELFEAIETGSVRAAATLKGQTPEALQAIKTSVADTISKYRQGEGYEIPMPAILVSASEP